MHFFTLFLVQVSVQCYPDLRRGNNKFKLILKHSSEMVRKIKINGSDKIICKHHENGYCRFKEECRFFHLKEVCESDQCDLNVCLKRHPIFCKFFKRKKCKFGDLCLFKHKNTQIKHRHESDEMRELKRKLELQEETIENLKKGNKQKDSEILSKSKEIEDLKDENKRLNERIRFDKAKNKAEVLCQICEKNFITKEDLKTHIDSYHKDNMQLIKAKEFIARLQGISNDLVKEKTMHKDICHIAKKCPHEMACTRNCYFLDELYIESDPEESDDDVESGDDFESETEDVDNESNKESAHNMCTKCNFEAKSLTGLKMHEKSDHKFKCDSCNFKTTTKLLIKKHVQDQHKI